MQLHFKQLGQGAPLVLLHGLFGQADNWLGVAPKLAEKFHVFIPDLRNHGQSPHDSEMTYPLMAADVEEFFVAHHLQKAHVIGHSMGGKAAMQFALDFAQRIEKLVIVDIAPRSYPPSHVSIFKALLGLDLSKFQSRTQIEEALAPEIPSLNLRRFLLKNLGRNAANQFIWKMNLKGIWDNYEHVLEPVNGKSPFRGPALFLRGGWSDHVTPADEPEIRRLFPAAHIETIAAASHWVHADAPGEFVKRIFGFL